MTATAGDWVLGKTVFHRVNATPCIVVASDSPGTVYADLTPLIRPSMVNMGLLMQASSTSAVTPSFTIYPGVCDSMVRSNPDGIPWSVQEVVPAGGMVGYFNKYGFWGKFEFAAAGVLYITCL